LHPDDMPGIPGVPGVPGDPAAPLEWRQGMALIQRFNLVRLPGSATGAEIENHAQTWVRPPVLHLAPEVYRAAGWRIPFRFEPARFPRTEFNFRDSFAFSWSR